MLEADVRTLPKRSSIRALQPIDLTFNLNTGNDTFDFISTGHLIYFDTIHSAVRAASSTKVRRTSDMPMREQFLSMLNPWGKAEIDIEVADRIAFLPYKTVPQNLRDTVVFSVCKVPYGLSVEGYKNLLDLTMRVFPTHKIIITGRSESEIQIGLNLHHNICNPLVMNYCGRLTLLEFLGLIRESYAVVCFDSLAMHLADLYCRRLLCFFKRHWNYRSYLPTTTPHASVCEFDTIEELTRLACEERESSLRP